MKKADLHIHSNASDGRLTPKEIVNLAKDKGIDYIAITDHNTMNGVEEAIDEGKRIGVKVIPGIELSTRYKGKQVHILGYFLNDKYKKSHLKEALNYIERKKLDGLKELFKDEINIKKGAKRLELQEGIKLLKIFGAKVFLAHPVKINENDLNEILSLNIDGIEAIHPRQNEEKRKYYIQLAKKNKIKYSAGSDFHGLSKKNLKHGIIGEIYIKIKDIKELL